MDAPVSLPTQTGLGIDVLSFDMHACSELYAEVISENRVDAFTAHHSGEIFL
jgi:hypothetical protein